MQPTIEHIIQDYKATVFKLCIGYATTTADAEDLVQETFVNIWKGLPSYRGTAHLKTWIYRITVNTCLLSLRKNRLKTVAITELDEARYSIKTEGVVVNENVEYLRRRIQQLPEQDRVIILLYLDELSHQEIAEVVGITPNYVGVKINRIKKKLSQT